MEGFSQKWNFPNCIGAIDGKHVLIKKPPKSGTIYRNYKKSFSVILLAVVDADYKFLYTDIGAPGSEGDAEEKKIFNYRLSRARRVVGNAFGILANRFRCFHTVINASPERRQSAHLDVNIYRRPRQ
ncbi:hypothetical protein MRX96_021545 [Rhipicephalus microplus]